MTDLKPTSYEEIIAKSQQPPPVKEAIKQNGEQVIKIDLDEKAGIKKEAVKTDDSGVKPPVESKTNGEEKKEPPKKQKLRDQAASFFDKTESGKTVGEIKKEQELPAEIRAKLKKLENPEVQTFIEAIESGKDIFSYMDEVRGVDASKMTPEQIFEYDLRKLGTTDDELADALVDFSAKPSWQKKKETEGLYQKYSGNKEQVLEKFRSRLKADSSAQSQALEITQRNYQNIVETSVGQKIDGVEISPQMASELKDYYNKNAAIPQKADGSLDEVALLKIAFRNLYWDLMIDNLEKNATAEGAEVILDLVDATKSHSSSQTQRSSDVPGKTVAPQDKERAHLDNLQHVTFEQLTRR